MPAARPTDMPSAAFPPIAPMAKTPTLPTMPPFIVVCWVSVQPPRARPGVQSVTEHKRKMTAAFAAQSFTVLLGAGVVLQPACVDVLGLGLVLLAYQPLAALVEIVG